MPIHNTSEHRLREKLRRIVTLLIITWMVFVSIPAQAASWYVGNTSAGDTVKYRKVYFAAGSYRFTARTGAAAAGKTIQLKVGGVTLRPGVAVPNTGRVDTFGYVHLGSRTLSAGTHDLEILFENGGVSLDWFMAVKDADSATSVKTSDTVMVLPPSNGVNFFPNFAYHQTNSNGRSSTLLDQGVPVRDANNNPYTDEQVQAWFSIPNNRDYDRRTDRYWDMMVDTFLAMRVQGVHSWVTTSLDFANDLQDREMATFGAQPRFLRKFAEAIARSPQAAASLRTSIRWDTGELGNDFKKYYGYFPGFADAELVDFSMDYYLSPFLDNMPPSLLFQPAPGEFVLRMESIYPRGVTKDGKTAKFLSDLRARIQQKYGIKPRYVFSTSSTLNAEIENEIWGLAEGMRWDGPLLSSNLFKGQYFHNTSNGSRHGLPAVWLNDWDPVTNTGTPAGNSAGIDSHQPRIDANGNSTWLTTLPAAVALGGPYCEYEGVTNLAEGNSCVRSGHPEFLWPNQHIAAMRQFADPITQTAMFEAEACDSYVKANPVGNAGGTYRREWYGQTNLDVYRPLHYAQPWKPASAGPGNLASLSAGFSDAWGVDAAGTLWGHRIVGNPDVWTKVYNPAPVPFKNVALSKGGSGSAWGLATTGAVYRATLGVPGANYNNLGWTLKTGTMAWISNGDTEVWATDASGNVFRQANSGSAPGWTPVPGILLDKVWVGDAHVWGIRGSTLYHAFIPTPPATNAITFVAVPNPNNITQLDVGSDEVWGINAAGNIYRMSASAAVGTWEAVPGPGAAVTKISVGENYVWVLAGTTPHFCKLEGFVDDDPPSAPVGLSVSPQPGKAVLTWLPVSGATSYTIQRATSSAGPFTNIGTSTTPTFTNTGLTNGTAYIYRIVATTPSGTSPISAALSATPAPAPLTPTGLTATAASIGEINVSWANPGPSAAGYILERGIGNNIRTFRKIAHLIGNGSTTYKDTPLDSGTVYSYRVRSYNANLVESANSGTANAQTAGDSTIFINFQPNDHLVLPLHVPGYLSDYGYAYGSRKWGTNTINYGWSIDSTGQPRLRGANSNMLLDTVLLWKTGATWSIEVPNGSYNVLVAIGDHVDTVSSSVNVNGVNYWTNQTMAPDQYVNATRLITVTNGKITMDMGAGTNNSVRLNYIQITPTASLAAAPSGLSGVAGNAQVALSWNTVNSATGYRVYQATALEGPFTLIASPTGTTHTATGLSNKNVTYYYRVAAIVGGVPSAQSMPIGVMPGTYQSPWLTQSIGGSPGDGGNQEWNSAATKFTLMAKGNDIHGTSDQFRFVYQAANGDCSIVARVASIENADSWTKVGVMIRETLASGASNVAMLITPGSGATFQCRNGTGGVTNSSTAGGITAPYWVKLTRVGNVFTGYISPDGTAWTQVGSPQTVAMSSTTYFGLAATSHNTNVWATATFDCALPVP